MVDCKSCEYFDLTQNKCYIDGKTGYANGEPLISKCENYELGHWGIPEEIEQRSKNRQR